MGFVKELEEKYLQSSDWREQVVLDKQYLAYLKEKIEKNPHDVQSLMHSGILSWEPCHDYEKAIEYLKKSIEIDPKNVDAHFWLATVYYHDYCEYEKAEEMSLKALAIDPTRGDCWARMGAISWHHHNDISKAIQYLQKAVEYAPDCPTFLHLLVTLLAEARHIQAAEFYLEKFIELAKVPPVKYRNGVEEYYETIVTGRAWKDKKKEVQVLTDRVEAAKKGIPSFIWTPPASWLEEDKKLANAKKHKPKTQ